MASSARPRTSRLLLKLFKKERSEVFSVLLYGIGVGVLSLVVPIGVQSIVNTVTFGSLSQPVVFLMIAVFLGLALAALFRVIQTVIVERLQVRFFATVALELSVRLPRVLTDRIAGSRFPELVNRFFDVLTVQKSTANLLLEGFGLVLQTFIGLVLLAFYHPVFLAFDLVLILAMVVIIFGLGRGAVSTSIYESKHKYRVVAWLEEIADKRLTFKTKEARHYAVSKADQLVSDYLESRGKHFKIVYGQVLGLQLMQALASALLLGIGAILVTRNQLTLGQLVAAEIVVTNILNSLSKVQKHLEAFYDLAASLDKIEDLVELPIENKEALSTLSTQGPVHLAVRDLLFSYSTEPLLKNLTFEVAAGEKLALRGINGSGKSTLVDILYGLKEPTHGQVLMDHTDYRELTSEEIRKAVALVRGVEVIPGSIIDNICVGRDFSIDQIKNALQKVGLLDDILRLSEGLKTQLQQNGGPLSIMQALQLMIARAIIASPRLLIIDESIDSFDATTAETLRETLFHPQAPWTLIICTHDQNTAVLCDQIVNLGTDRQGRAA